MSIYLLIRYRVPGGLVESEFLQYVIASPSGDGRGNLLPG